MMTQHLDGSRDQPAAFLRRNACHLTPVASIGKRGATAPAHEVWALVNVQAPLMPWALSSAYVACLLVAPSCVHVATRCCVVHLDKFLLEISAALPFG
jgi:hypothetical protein